jgi:hypothetical protein
MVNSNSGESKTYDNILEPYTTIFKLGLLSFMPIGTKISFKNNNIYIQNPSMLQGVSRWKNGDQFSDLHNLVHPLKKYMELNTATEKQTELFTRLALNGLERLGKTYAKNNIILQALELYKDILNGEKTRRLSDESDDSSRLSNVFDIYEKIIVIWKQDEIEILYDILLHLNNHIKEIDDLENDPYINSIIRILEKKEIDTTEILKNLHKM